jgi:hypothetical protein
MCGGVEAVFGEQFADALPQGDDVLGLVASSDVSALKGVEEFEPVGQGWFGKGNPFDLATASSRTFEKGPSVADVLCVDVALEAVLARCGPSDLCLGSHVS